MGKRDSAPTVSWVIFSRINKWLAVIFILLLLVVAWFAWEIKRQLKEDCVQTFDRTFIVGSNWIDLRVGDTDRYCTQPTRIEP